MRRPLFGGAKPPGLAELASDDGSTPVLTSASPFADAAAAAAAASGLGGAHTGSNPHAATNQAGGRGTDSQANHPRPNLARALSNIASAAVADLSYLADPAAAVEEGDEAAGGLDPTSPRAAAAAFAPLQAAATAPAAPPPPPASPIKASYPAQKFVFTLSLLVISLQAFWLGAAPMTVFQLYTVEALVLLPFRFFTYRAKKAHYYLLDLCYVANGVTLYSLWVAPASLVARHAAFAFGAGPLLWAILAFRNAAVLHDPDKMTSLWLHAGPALVVWAARWRPGPLAGMAPTSAAAAAARAAAARVGLGGGLGGFTGRASPVASTWWERAAARGAGPAALLSGAHLPPGWDAATPAQLLRAAAPVYFAWALSYYAYLFVFAAKKIRDRKYETLYGYLTRKETGAVTRAVARYPPQYRPLAFMGFHALSTAAVIALSAALWHSYALHTGAIVAAIALSGYNGASFYEYLIKKAAKAGREAGVREGGKVA